MIDRDDPFVQLAEDRQRIRVVNGAECDFVIDDPCHLALPA